MKIKLRWKVPVPSFNAFYECTTCRKRFNRKNNLKRHSIIHLSNVFECATCSKKFRCKRYLKDHISILHRSQMNLIDEQNYMFECKTCSKKFRCKKYLEKHISRLHQSEVKFLGKPNDIFECTTCLKQFRCERYLKEHISMLHPSHLNLPDEPNDIFECATCSRIFRCKSYLKKHISRLHQYQVNLPAEPNNIFECATCSKKFRFKRYLKEHIFRLHRFQVNLPNELHDVFECALCSRTFNKKNYVRRHIRTHKNNLVQKKACRIKCLECSKIFRYNKELNEHYIQVHKIALMYQKLEFDSVRNYEQWLEYQQTETMTQFRVWYRKRFSSHSIEHRVCHRSGDFYKKLDVDCRKRYLKKKGYKGLGGTCPADIKVHIQNDGRCFVTYQKTHVGHNIKDKSELALIYLSKTEKDKIAAKIASGIPLDQIVNEERHAGFGNEHPTRLSLINYKDLQNIASSRRLNCKNQLLFRPGNDVTDSDAAIAAHSDDILFHKKQMEEDTRFKIFGLQDFVLVIMTKNQEKYLRTYGEKIICIYSTHDTNPYGFMLHTLLVFDSERLLPGAFLLTNRNDRDVVDVFLTCIRDCVGIVNTQTFISDMQSMYFNSWVRIMKTPQNHFFCSWHVSEAWRRNYVKIANKSKREMVRRELKYLMHEADPLQFNTDLNSFLSRKDDDLTDFQAYFRQNYGSNITQWAYCYRIEASINTNMRLEGFHRTFKHVVAGGKKITSLTQYLEFIFQYLDLLATNILEKNIRSKITWKLSAVRNRHHLALEQFKKDALSRVISIGNDTFFVQSFVDINILYIVSMYETKECILEDKRCELVCSSCDFCFHTFKCTCRDSSIASNMCKHIHLVGIYLMNQNSLESNKKSNIVKDGTRATTDTKEYLFNKVPQNSENSINSVAGVQEEIKKVFDEIMLADPKHQQYIFKKFIKPISSALSTFTC